MKHGWAFFLALAISVLSGQDTWEQVYPEPPANINSARLLCVEVADEEVMIGSEQGRVIVDFGTDSDFWISAYMEPFEKENAHLLRLNVSFDVLAIAKVEGGWVLGGPAGQIAYSRFKPRREPPSFDPWGAAGRAAFAQSWRQRRIPGAGPIGRLAGSGERVVALSDGKLYLSRDRGDTWEEISGQSGVRDLETFRGDFYAISQFKTGYEYNLELRRSEDGLTWDSVWIVRDIANYSEIGLRPLSLATDGLGDVIEQGLRLNVIAHYSHPWNKGTLHLSSVDGITWQDTGSFDANLNKMGNYWRPLNPLGLPDSQRFLSTPPLQPNPHSLNYSVNDNRLVRFLSYEWETKLLTAPGEQAHSVVATAWDELVLVSETGNLTRIDASGETHLSWKTAPDTENWAAFATTGDKHYALVEAPENGVGLYLQILDNLEGWSEFRLEGNVQYWRLKPASSKVGLFYGVYDTPSRPFAQRPFDEIQRGLQVLGEEESEPILMEPNRRDIAFLPATGKWVALWHDAQSTADDGKVHVDELSPSGEHIELASFTPESWNGYFHRIDAPDGERLIAYGNCAELAIIEKDGTTRVVHPWKFFPSNAYRIDKVRFVNGWYYLIGDVTVVTQDFDTFHAFEGPPVDEPVTEVLQFGTNLYVVAGGNVFKQPLVLGYLDSILREQGWRQSTWLGWFTVLHEEAGRIHHLQLGPTVVTRESGNRAILETTALGSLMTQTDWMPWAQRQSDGHWLWLDLESWPLRVWDDSAGAWLQL